jgi:glutathione S-transferase
MWPAGRGRPPGGDRPFHIGSRLLKKATLFAVPASHPSLAAELMLRHKGVPYRRIDLITAAHRRLMRLLGFPGDRVPALRIEGRRVQGSREIAAALDELKPQPPLFPADPERRAAVVEAERWGDEVYQAVPRRLVWGALKRDRSTVGSYLEGARLGVPVSVAKLTTPPIIRAAVRLNEATDEALQQDLRDLPALLDHIDALVRDGVIGGAELNAADFQIGTSTALLATMEDMQPLLAGRPALEHARRVAPAYPGRLPQALPAGWLHAPSAV